MGMMSQRSGATGFGAKDDRGPSLGFFVGTSGNYYSDGKP
jgi:hypothetical protein